MSTPQEQQEVVDLTSDDIEIEEIRSTGRRPNHLEETEEDGDYEEPTHIVQLPLPTAPLRHHQNQNFGRLEMFPALSAGIGTRLRSREQSRQSLEGQRITRSRAEARRATDFALNGANIPTGRRRRLHRGIGPTSGPYIRNAVGDMPHDIFTPPSRVGWGTRGFSNFLLRLAGFEGLGVGGRDDDEELRQAMLLSMQEEQPQRSLDVEDIKNAPMEPKDTRKGFSRAIKPDLRLICAYCDVLLGEGIADMTDEDKEANRKSGVTDADVLLSKRVFFSKCGHVYCGKCVSMILNRRRSKKIPGSCVVEGCGSRFREKKRKPFTEIYY